MRTKALGQPDRQNVVGEVTAASFQGVGGYVYEIKGYGVAQDYYFDSGTGILSVDCTVSVWGSRSEWSKDFHFESGKITDMDYRRR